MANIRIRSAVERISKDIDKTVKHAIMYSGVSKSDADAIDREATSVCEQAARLAGLARVARGQKPGDDEKLVKAVRKALGFTSP